MSLAKINTTKSYYIANLNDGAFVDRWKLQPKRSNRQLCSPRSMPSQITYRTGPVITTRSLIRRRSLHQRSSLTNRRWLACFSVNSSNGTVRLMSKRYDRRDPPLFTPPKIFPDGVLYRDACLYGESRHVRRR